MNVFPVQRGGGRAALSYAEELIDKGWSLVFFPEGTRTTTGKLGHFGTGFRSWPWPKTCRWCRSGWIAGDAAEGIDRNQAGSRACAYRPANLLSGQHNCNRGHSHFAKNDGKHARRDTPRERGGSTGAET
jgi:Acyltransferase